MLKLHINENDSNPARDIDKNIKRIAMDTLRGCGIENNEAFINGKVIRTTSNDFELRYYVEVYVDSYDMDYIYDALDKVQTALSSYLDNLSNVSDVSMSVYDKTDMDDDVVVTLAVSGTVNASNQPVYTVNKDMLYCSRFDDLEELFSNSGLAYNDLENKLEQAGWIQGTGIYIPKNTRFVQTPNDGYFYYIKILNGPLKGTTLSFDMYDDSAMGIDNLINNSTC